MNYDEGKVAMWINSIIDVIAQVADLEFQKKAWLEGKSFLSISLAETACQLYDDSRFRSFLEKSEQEGWLPEDALKKLQVFDFEFNKYLDEHGTYDHVELETQTDPHWHRVQAFAKEVLKDFKNLGFIAPDLSKLEYLDP